jgi:hypothetical protein
MRIFLVHTSWSTACATALALAAIAPLAAQSPSAGQKPPTKIRSLDQQLLDDLDRDLLQGLPGGSKPKPATPAMAPGEAETHAAADSQNPLANLAERMRKVERRMAGHDTSTATQDEQAQILKDIAALLADSHNRQGSKDQRGPGNSAAQAGAGTGSASPGPPRDSTNRIERGTKEETETADVRDVLRHIWGHLPEKLRDEMQASLSEQFLPKYERMIEEYYKRLAEDRPVGP